MQIYSSVFSQYSSGSFCHTHSPLLPANTQSWLVAQTTVYGMKLSTPFQLIGQVGLDDYEKWTKWFQEEQTVSTRSDPLTCRSYAR